MVCGELLAGAETPEYADSADAGVAAGLHVRIGISDIDDLVEPDVGSGGHGLVHDRRIRLDRQTVPLAEHLDETVFSEEDADQFLGAVLVFVGGEGEADAGFAEPVHHVHDAGIGPGTVADVRVIVREEQRRHPGDVLLVVLLRWQRGPEQVPDTPAAENLVRLHRMLRESERPQGVVGGVSEVFHRIQQGSVQIENDQFCHFLKKVEVFFALCLSMAQAKVIFATEKEIKLFLP